MPATTNLKYKTRNTNESLNKHKRDSKMNWLD